MKVLKVRFRRRSVSVYCHNGKFCGEVEAEKGFETEAVLYPYVIEGPKGPVEVADVEMPGGDLFVAVPYKNIQFVD